jgi:hypothetical protein
LWKVEPRKGTETLRHQRSFAKAKETPGLEGNRLLVAISGQPSAIRCALTARPVLPWLKAES